MVGKRKSMVKWFAIFLLCSTISTFSFSSEIVVSEEALEHLNQEITLCGLVKQVNKTNHRTYLNLGGVYPNHKFSFAISQEFYPQFSEKFGDFQVLQNKRVCAKGIVIQDKRGKPRINIENPHLLRFAK